MADYAKVTVDKNALSSLHESINIGKGVLERKLLAYRKRMERFEETKGMDTESFSKMFARGELGDDKEWLEWDHLASVVSVLQKKVRDLESLKYES